MAENDDQTLPATPPAVPNERIWSEPIVTGEPVPLDPNEYEPTLSDEEVQKYLEEQDKK